MKTLKTIIGNNVLCTLIIFMALSLVSCEDENVGEFKLTGNIEHLIPDDSYSINITNTDNGQYIICTPYLHSLFEYWGLTLKQVEYYIDDEFYKTETIPPFELKLNKDDIAVGNHMLKTRMTIVGENCDDLILENEDEFYISSTGSVSKIHGDIYIDYNYVTKGDELVITPELLVERSSNGCMIDEVKYYWDGTLISTITSSPFTFKYKVNDEVGTSHKLMLSLKFHDNSSTGTFNWSYNNYKVYTADDFWGTWDIKSRRNDYINGETLSLAAKVFKGANVKNNHEIEFYLDDDLIGKSSSFPYILDYKLDKLSIGSHTIKGKIITKKGDLTISSQSKEQTIIITK